MDIRRSVIEDRDGDGALRLPDETLQKLGVEVGDSRYLIAAYAGTARCLVLSRTPQRPDRLAARVEHGDRAEQDDRHA